MNTGTIKIEATTKQISLKIKETYTWFEKPKSYCLNITVKITVRQRTLIRTLRHLFVNSALKQLMTNFVDAMASIFLFKKKEFIDACTSF